jgi:hypothetical protein
MRVERIRQPPLQARFRRFVQLAETQHDAPLAGVYDVEPARQPDYGSKSGDQPDTTAELAEVQVRHFIPAVTTTRATTPTEHAGEATIEITPQLFEVGRPLIAIATTVVATAAITPFGIV